MLTAAVGILGGVVTWVLARRALHVGARSRARQARGLRSTRLPEGLRARLARALVDAGIDVPPESALGWWALGSLSAALFGAVLSPAVCLLAAATAAAAGPLLLAAGRARRRRALDAAVPELLERVAAELRSGGTVATAVLERSRTGPLGLSEVTRRVQLGAGFTDALRAWSERLGRGDVRAAAGALGLAATVGGRSADALDALAGSLRGRLAAIADGAALAAQARLSAIVVGGAPLAFLVFTALADPAAAGAQLGTAVGRASLAIGLAMEAAAAVWIRRIVRSEP